MNFYDQYDTSDDLYSDKSIKYYRKLRKIDRKDRYIRINAYKE